MTEDWLLARIPLAPAVAAAAVLWAITPPALLGVPVAVDWLTQSPEALSPMRVEAAEVYLLAPPVSAAAVVVVLAVRRVCRAPTGSAAAAAAATQCKTVAQAAAVW